MSNPIIANIKRIPPVTRFFTISTVLACFAVTNFSASESLYINLNTLLNEYALIRLVSKTGSKFQLLKVVVVTVLSWYRFVTSFLIPSGLFPPSMSALLDTYFFYTFSNHLEAHEGKFKGNFPDYLWFIILCGTFIQVLNLLIDAITGNFTSISYFPHENLLACITYVWSRSLKNAKINLLGIIPIKAYYLPLGNLIVKLILGGPVALVDTLVGILSGYLYLCLQSQTLPFYNLIPGAYGKFNTKKNHEGRRVGMTHIDNQEKIGGYSDDFIVDSIYDKGWLKAPIWLYKLLSYPTNTSVRTTAFTTVGKAPTININKRQEAEVNVTGRYSWFGNDGNAFRGRGHRLGD
ncbi:uncharacterized protein KGF55_003803 [Candida pseudojiufengensis]|uniref:uncharacterized protein n=1 Tax=Candida pseudojiufengensis TaxID=497109 RepID=UPI002225927F|nr:uncharacterized protein KGF55_003803 [Candida pseudojiufengensis]KAI5961832.1 hypothetical protein KGF55_003803 [Candida pseudojiufengensis]